MLSRFLIGLLMLSGVAALATPNDGPAPLPPGVVGPDCPPPGPAANVLFDCLDGPGYLRVTVVDVYGNHRVVTPYTGSRQDCLAQAAVLKASRSVVMHPSVIAVCSPTPSYQLRWQVDGWGNLVALPQTYYANRGECLADAAALNKAP